MPITVEQKLQIEKTAGALSYLFNSGKALMKPVGLAASATRHVASPFAKMTGAGIRGAGKLTGGAINRVGMPLVSGAAKAGAKGTAALAAPVAGAVAETGKIIGNNIAAPATRMLSRSLKRNPIGTTMTLGFGGLGMKDIYNRHTSRNFYNSPSNLSSYANKKLRFNKVGSDMTPEQKKNIEKTAGAIGAIKKAVGYGGPSLLGALGMGGLTLAASPILVPSLNAAGDSIRRNLFPLDSRINAEEEVAKKQLGIAAAHQMDQMLGQQDAMGRNFKAMPQLEQNLEYIVSNDPIVSDMVGQDPSKVDTLRETINTVYEFAPDIATNRQAAQSILRESAMSPDGGLNYNTIKLIADAQKSISGGR